MKSNDLMAKANVLFAPSGRPSNPPPSRPRRLPPLSIRLSKAERDALKQKARTEPLSTYIKSVLFADGVPVGRRSSGKAATDRKEIARLLAVLGTSCLASNLAQIAKHANLGNLVVDQDLQARLDQACIDIQEMRAALMRALGKEVAEAAAPPNLSEAFHMRATQPRPHP